MQFHDFVQLQNEFRVLLFSYELFQIRRAVLSENLVSQIA